MRLQFIWFKAGFHGRERERGRERKAHKGNEWASGRNRRSRESERNASDKAIKEKGGEGSWRMGNQRDA